MMVVRILATKTTCDAERQYDRARHSRRIWLRCQRYGFDHIPDDTPGRAANGAGFEYCVHIGTTRDLFV